MADRTPEEVTAEAEPVIRAVLPDERADLHPHIRTPGRARAGVGGGRGPRHLARRECRQIARVISTGDAEGGTFWPSARVSARVRRLAPELSKGLEFDLVVLIDPDAFGTGIEGALDRYVSMIRATRQLVILATHSR